MTQETTEITPDVLKIIQSDIEHLKTSKNDLKWHCKTQKVNKITLGTEMIQNVNEMT